MKNLTEAILTIEGRQFKIKAPDGWSLEQIDIEQAKQDILSGKISIMNPATCSDVVQGSARQITLTATGGKANYTYKLFLDGIQVDTAGPVAATSYTFTRTLNQSISSHILKGEITDGCPTPQTATDQCTFNIIAPVTTGSISCTTVPAGASISVDGANQNGVTPVTLTNVSVGSHTVIFTLGGYDACSKTVTVTAGSTATASCTMTQTSVTICTWITNNGGVSGITIPKIFILVDAYTGVTTIGFIPTNQQIFGTVDYYLGFITSGNSKTGCSF